MFAALACGILLDASSRHPAPTRGNMPADSARRNRRPVMPGMFAGIVFYPVGITRVRPAELSHIAPDMTIAGGGTVDERR